MCSSSLVLFVAACLAVNVASDAPPLRLSAIPRAAAGTRRHLSAPAPLGFRGADGGSPTAVRHDSSVRPLFGGWSNTAPRRSPRTALGSPAGVVLAAAVLGIAVAWCRRRSRPTLAIVSFTGRTSDTGRPARRPLSLSAAPPTDTERSAAALEGFAQWRQRNGVSSPLLELRVTPGAAGGRGAFALQPVAAGDVLVDLPRSLVLGVVDGASTPFPDFVPDAGWRLLPFQAQLACRLLHERRLGEASPFTGYIAQLPTTFDRAVRLSHKELASLQYPYLERAVQSERTMVSGWRQTLRDHGSPCPTGPPLDWATDVVFSRLFSGPLASGGAPIPLAARAALIGGGVFLAGAADNLPTRALGAAAVAATVLADLLAARQPAPVLYGLFPMVDAFNHRTRGTTVATPLEYAAATDRFVLRADGACAAASGEEVFISYGPLGNDDLLLRYGFVETDNPCDTYSFLDILAQVPKELLGPTTVQLPATLRRDGTLDDAATAALAEACGGRADAARTALRAAVSEELRSRRRIPAPAPGPRAKLLATFLEQKLRVLTCAADALSE